MTDDVAATGADMMEFALLIAESLTDTADPRGPQYGFHTTDVLDFPDAPSGFLFQYIGAADLDRASSTLVLAVRVPVGQQADPVTAEALAVLVREATVLAHEGITDTLPMLVTVSVATDNHARVTRAIFDGRAAESLWAEQHVRPLLPGQLLIVATATYGADRDMYEDDIAAAGLLARRSANTILA